MYTTICLSILGDKYFTVSDVAVTKLALEANMLFPLGPSILIAICLRGLRCTRNQTFSSFILEFV